MGALRSLDRCPLEKKEASGSFPRSLAGCRLTSAPSLSHAASNLVL